MRGPSPSDLADELAAFANSRTGGTLLLGIDDKTRDVLGIPVDRLDLVEALVRQAVEDSINPPLAPVIERLTLPDSLGVDHATLRVDIASSLFVHQSPSGYLHRVGSSKRPIPPDYLAQLFQQRSQSRLIRFDELAVMSAQCEDLDTVLLERFHPQLSPDANWQSKTGLVVEAEDGSFHPSVAGVLLASLNPQQFLKGAYIQAVAYAGTQVTPQGEDVMYQRDAADLTGPLDQQITGACRFVARNSRTGAAKTLEGGRIDRPQFDALAVFEAITNAVAHRDYSIASLHHGSSRRRCALDYFSNTGVIRTASPIPPHRQQRAAAHDSQCSVMLTLLSRRISGSKCHPRRARHQVLNALTSTARQSFNCSSLDQLLQCLRYRGLLQ
jgi:predicted HTH transcriptional regulator